MKILKNISLLLVVLFAITGTTQSMDQTPSWKKRSKWLVSVGKVALGYEPIAVLISKNSSNLSDLPTSEAKEFKEFTNLPKDVQNQIIGILISEQNANSPKEAAKTISALSQVNKELNALINDPQFYLEFIKSLAKKFNTNDLDIAQELKTSRAKEIAHKQSILWWKTYLNGYSDVKAYVDDPEIATTIDLNFSGATGYLLDFAIQSREDHQTDDQNTIKKIQLLLDKGANPNLKRHANSLSPLENTIKLKNDSLQNGDLENSKFYENIENLMKTYGK